MDSVVGVVYSLSLDVRYGDFFTTIAVLLLIATEITIASFVCSVTKTKVLDASGPPGLPSLLPGAFETMVTTAISALSFSPDGEVPVVSP